LIKLSGPFPNPTSLFSLATFLISSNSFIGLFPSDAAPPSLASCVVDPVPNDECPDESVLKDASSLANRCKLQCRGGGEEEGADSAGGIVGVKRD
jgi:hypothetical protein